MPVPLFFTQTSSRPDETWDLAQLVQAFELLTAQVVSKQTRLNVEEKKRRIMQLILQKIKQECGQATPEKSSDQTHDVPWMTRMIRASYSALLVFGLIENLTNSYFFGATLFALLPSITDPTLIMMSIIYAILDSVLFYLFEASLLKEALGLELAPTKTRRLMDLYTEQVDTMSTINQMLSSLSALKLDDANYLHYMRFIVTANRDLQTKYTVMAGVKESWLKQVLKTGVFAFGMISSLSGSYFVAITFMTLLAAPLVGTPVGWLMVLSIMALGLGFHYAMGSTGMTRVVNPDYLYYQTLKQKFETFHEVYGDNLEDAQSLRFRFGKKPTQDASTQTEDTMDNTHCCAI